MISLTLLAEKLKREKSVAVFMHVRPDGDAIGSGLALFSVLKKAGIDADVYSSDKIPEKFFFLPEAKEIKNEIVKINGANKKYTALVAVDVADLARAGVFAELFMTHKNTYNIDHHVSNTRYAAFNYVRDTAANCENVMDLIEAMGESIDDRTANFLALGIVTDTGNFVHKNVTEETFFKAGKLIKLGADFNAIYFNNFVKQSKERAKLFGVVMSRIRYFLDGKLAICTVFKSDLTATGAKPEETEGFIDFVMGIEGVEVGICVMELDKNKFKASFRSKKADVNAVAASFGGGGHVLASGCQVNGDYEEVIDKFRFAVSKYIEE